MALISINWLVAGVPTNAFSVEFGDSSDVPVGTFGVRRTDTSQELVIAGVALDNPATGEYEYDVTEPSTGLIYEYWASVVDEEGDPPVVLHGYVTGTGETGITKVLQFVAVADGAPLVLSPAAKLSNPSGTFGVRRMDTDAQVVSDATAYTHLGGGQYNYGFLATEGVDYRYYVEAVVGSVTYHLPRTTALISSAALAIGRYTDSHRIETTFGVDNVHKWCSIDDHDDAVDYALRMYQLIAAAEAEIDDVLRGSAVSVPLTTTIPSIVTEIATALAAVRMYEARGVVDFNTETGQPQHRLQYQKKEAWKRLAMLKAGQLRLDGETVQRHPEVVCDDD